MGSIPSMYFETRRNFWFLLVDDRSGQPYMGSTTTFVSLMPTDQIHQFSKAVKAEFGADITSGNSYTRLQVYKNKAAFDKRNAIEGGEEPLKSSLLLGNLGLTEEDPIYVTLASIFQSDLTCTVSFYNDICTSELRDERIDFRRGIPSSTMVTSLYVRKSYKTIASAILEGLDKVIVTGTPGIGKSFFLIYLLWKLVQEKKRVLFIYESFKIYYDGKGQILMLKVLPPAVASAFWTKDLWCLFDAKHKSKLDLNEVPYNDCCIVVSASPQEDMFDSFQKSPAPSWFFMPLWSIDELETASIKYPTVTAWKSRFEVLGGIPRWVLQETRHHQIKILENAFDVCSLDDCLFGVSPKFVVCERNKVVHQAIHITSTEPYTTASVCFASQAAFPIMNKVKGAKAKVKMWSLLSSCESQPHIAEFCAYFFKQYVIRKLERGGQFTCRRIGLKRKKQEEKHLDVPKSRRRLINKVHPDGRRSQQLHIPKSRNYTGLDAWIPSMGGFQITITNTNNIQAAAQMDLGLLHNTLYWVLPPSTYDTFTHSPLPNITQYAILIPDPGSIQR